MCVAIEAMAPVETKRVSRPAFGDRTNEEGAYFPHASRTRARVATLCADRQNPQYRHRLGTETILWPWLA